VLSHCEKEECVKIESEKRRTGLESKLFPGLVPPWGTHGVSIIRGKACRKRHSSTCQMFNPVSTVFWADALAQTQVKAALVCRDRHDHEQIQRSSLPVSRAWSIAQASWRSDDEKEYRTAALDNTMLTATIEVEPS
jgi:hypothetical protein